MKKYTWLLNSPKRILVPVRRDQVLEEELGEAV